MVRFQMSEYNFASRPEHVVADMMAANVVHGLEVVEIDIAQHGAPPGVLGLRHPRMHRLDERPAVE